MLIEPGSSSSGGGAAAFQQLEDCFLFDMLGGSGPNLTSGMNGIILASSATKANGGTNAVVPSIMGVLEGVSMPYYTTVLVLEIDMNILCETSP